ncbi:DUF3060 domain-containing protein [Curtobacterium sp. RRHDQ10]|uniref:DUF3060 domain-containing protein n=1 Tax=Curtobacterium phyllosphaerae TaxID=3413379 RepID=UPI003BF05989
MRAPTLVPALGGMALAAVALAGCTNASTTHPTPSSSPTDTTGTTNGLADPEGACVDGVATPTGSGERRTLDDCDLIDVMGSKNTLRAGTTKQLTVEGSGNTITVDAVTTVTTTGKDNTIEYSGDEPTFNELGTGNKVVPSHPSR